MKFENAKSVKIDRTDLEFFISDLFETIDNSAVDSYTKNKSLSFYYYLKSKLVRADTRLQYSLWLAFKNKRDFDKANEVYKEYEKLKQQAEELESKIKYFC